MTTSNGLNVDNRMIHPCIPTKGSSSRCLRGRQSLCRQIQQRQQQRPRCLPTRVVPRVLGSVQVQPLRTHLMVSPVNRTLHLGPKTLDSVRVDVAAHVFPAAMVHAVVIVAPPSRVVVDRQFVRVDGRAAFDALGQEREHLRGGDAGDDLHTHPAAALHEANYGRLAGCATATLAARSLPAAIRLVALDGALQLVGVRVVVHQLADALGHPPRGLVRDSELTFQLQRGHAVLVRAHEEHGHEPERQRRGRMVEDRSGRGADLRAAPRAGERLPARYAVEAVTLSTRADGTVLAVSLLEQVEQTGVVVGELLAEIGESVLRHLFLAHAFSLIAKHTVAVDLQILVHNDRLDTATGALTPLAWPFRCVATDKLEVRYAVLDPVENVT